MKRNMIRLMVICAVVSCVVFGAWTAQAQQKQDGASSGVRAVNNQTAVACNLCFTCGGDWPVFAGSFTPVGNNPTERGGACSGALIVRSDSRPFLCCR